MHNAQLMVLSYFIFTFIIEVCVCVHTCVCVCMSVGHGSQVEVRGQIAEVSTLLPSRGSQGLKLSRLVAGPFAG